MGFTEGEIMKKILLLISFSSILFSSGCAASPVEPIQVVGSITVPTLFLVDAQGNGVASSRKAGQSFESIRLEDGGTCLAKKGYDDIRGGAQVTVKDNKGEIVAIGSLRPGIQSGSLGYTYADYLSDKVPPICKFGFALEAPAGKGFYSVSIGGGNRGSIAYTEEELKLGVFLTLGR
jgi:hypothetical protein